VGPRTIIETEPRDRLQPALLDRLTRDEGEGARVITKSELRQAVLRDLSWLFNATQPHPQWAEERPDLAGTVLNYGLPPMAGRQLSKIDISKLERTIAETIRRFEPRILPDSLSVRALESETVLDTHNKIEFEIRGQLWAQPVPLEILLRTQMDLEAGQVEVREAGASVATVARAPQR
jgi:type VI secretion system protein ImpF